VISFLSESYYRATPSGVFFDCIKWEIPILSLNNPFINYYFSKYDKVGEIFNNTPEMVEFIKDNLINSVYDFNNYMLYLKNLKKLKHFLSVEKLSEQFAKQI
jgi:hemoglobin-like flavoprotein